MGRSGVEDGKLRAAQGIAGKFLDGASGQQAEPAAYFGGRADVRRRDHEFSVGTGVKPEKATPG